MKALILDAERRTAGVEETAAPRPAPNELLIRVQAVALNPVDSLYVFNPLASSGRVVGSDFAGVVEALGDTVPPASSLKSGDRVAGFLQGACSVKDRPGAFAEYLVCPWDLVWKVKDGMRLHDAAAVSLCGLTAAQALFFRMGMDAPFQWPEQPATAAGSERGQEQRHALSFFIYGASTSVGMYAAQLVRRSVEASQRPVKLFGAASQKHSTMLKAEPYCYTSLVDYRDADWSEEVLRLTDGAGVDFAYDCISEGATVVGTSKTLASGGKMAVVRSREGGAWSAQNLPVEPSYGAVWEGLGEDVQYQGMSLPASPPARVFAVAFYRWLSEGEGGARGKGRLEANPLREMPGGLGSIAGDGLKLLGSGTMGDRQTESGSAREWMRPLSAEKMVYTV